VKALQPVLNLLGDTKTDILNAIDRAGWRGDTAAATVKTPVSNVWAQIPELYPEVKSLRGTIAGAPLNRQVATEGSDFAREMLEGQLTPNRMARQFDPVQGWSDPKGAVQTMLEGGVKTEAERTPNLLSNLKDNIVSKVVGLINPLDWPAKGAGAIAQTVSRGTTADLAKALASNQAAEALRGIVNYSPGVNFAQMLARSLLRLEAMSGPPAEPLRIDITGGNKAE
jgi:hypothetical protein